jgi:16S rRNA G966 N2-methylase RsmD
MTRISTKVINQLYARLRRLVSETLFERRFGVQTAGRIPLDDFGLAAENRVYYVPASWLTLRRALPRSAVTEHDVFIDFGSGMGRMVLEAATYPFKRVIGIELSEQLHDIAHDNIERNRHRLRCKDVVLVRSDALGYQVPDDVTVVFFNNPFRDKIFAAVIQQLLDSIDRKPRTVRVIYYNPVEDPFLMRTGRFLTQTTIPRPRAGRSWSPWGTTRTYIVT